jgi:predicted TIM-barrel fold metal-dependent hydrolase
VLTQSGEAIIDCHVHFVNVHAHSYQLFKERSASFEALVGDYSALPRRYLPDDYLKDASGFNVVKTVWAEFLSDDPLAEVRWAQNLSCKYGGYPHGLIALADFLSPDIAQVIERYASIPGVRAVRQHLAFDANEDLRRPGARPNILADKVWRERLALLSKYHLRCEMEILAPSLPDFAAAARSYPDMQFILPLIGWPIDVTDAGHRTWRRDMKALCACENVAVKIFGMECIFGLNWTTDQVRAWILETIDLFGPGRCMFASHMPIARLSRPFKDVYGAYSEIVSDFSASEKRKLFHDTAAAVYGL